MSSYVLRALEQSCDQALVKLLPLLSVVIDSRFEIWAGGALVCSDGPPIAIQLAASRPWSNLTPNLWRGVPCDKKISDIPVLVGEPRKFLVRHVRFLSMWRPSRRDRSIATPSRLFSFLSCFACAEGIHNLDEKLVLFCLLCSSVVTNTSYPRLLQNISLCFIDV